MLQVWSKASWKEVPMTDDELWDEAMELAELMGLPEFSEDDDEPATAVWLANDRGDPVRELPDN